MRQRDATFVFCLYLTEYSNYGSKLLSYDSLSYALSVIHIHNIKPLKRNHSVRPAPLVHVHFVRIYATTMEGWFSIKTMHISHSME